MDMMRSRRGETSSCFSWVSRYPLLPRYPSFAGFFSSACFSTSFFAKSSCCCLANSRRSPSQSIIPACTPTPSSSHRLRSIGCCWRRAQEGTRTALALERGGIVTSPEARQHLRFHHFKLHRQGPSWRPREQQGCNTTNRPTQTPRSSIARLHARASDAHRVYASPPSSPTAPHRPTTFAIHLRSVHCACFERFPGIGSHASTVPRPEHAWMRFVRVP